MTSKNYALISGIVFLIVAFAHAWRLYIAAPVNFGGSPVPMGASWVALIIAGILAFFGLRLSARN